MLQIFAITFPFFALVAAGYLAARRRLLPLEAIPGLNGFVLFFALPCMLYRFGSNTPLAQLLDFGVLAVWGVCALVLVGGVVLLARNERIGWNDAAFGALVAAFPNTGFMGVPLLIALLGAAAAGPIIVTITFDMVVTSSLCIALSRLDGAHQHGASRALRQALRGVFVNPLPWSIVLGTAASALGWRPAAPVWQTLSMLADAASPVALFTIGAVLARSAMNEGAARRQGAEPVRRHSMDHLPLVPVKLLIHPLMVWLAGRAAIGFGLPLSPSALVAIVLVAALPSASNVSMLAERFGADTGRVARIILLTTVAAFLSFPLIAAWLR
ncbi:MAG: AEC family transporter [Comamonadaceae bacterium]|nr:MAG: AEC family transporter [Comamonadaceae bacterium]